VFNAPALRDNIRESAAEYALFAHVLASLQLDVSDCPGATPSTARFDASKIALMGHSMGSTIAPLVLSAEPLYRAAVLSGAGASWIENIVWKQQPIDVRTAFELLLGYRSADRVLEEDDPVLTLFQWAEEPADPLVYTRAMAEGPPGASPPHVLMEQGIVDHYILPPIANATSLSLRLDLADPPLDATNAELAADGAPTLESQLLFSKRSQITLPASGNRVATGGVHVTTVVVQHPGDGVEDGHEVVFQTDPPKREYRCFLQTWAAGQLPRVPLPGDVEGPCQ
jgi:pimeloyl-ACP methyl ester carboxylesterase